MSLDKTVLVNQIGYKTKGTKLALLRNAKEGDEFFIKNADGAVVFKGTAASPVNDDTAREDVSVLDFSSLEQEGTFTAVCKNEESFPFSINTKPYDSLYYSLLNYFSLSRCGQDIADQNPADKGKWNHSACHTGTAEIYGEPGKTKNVQGGWHDAGDYGRYIVAGAKTVMDLLRAYEYSKDIYDGFDILKEVRFELEWFLQMQREDGGVYHKISCYHFCPFILPEEEKDVLVLAPVSTSATADFAGSCAFASGFYEAADPEFAKSLLDAAIKAQNYLDSHEDELYKNPEGITTGGYGDWNVRDERYFALCALFARTGNAEYLLKAKQIRKEAMELPFNPAEPWKCGWMECFAWGSVAAYGTEILLKDASQKAEAAVPGFICELKEEMLKRADGVLQHVNSTSYKTPLIKVFWGSNGQVCDEAHILLLAADVASDSKRKTEYIEAAKRQLDYLLGLNPLSYCYVSGFGSKPVKHPHHRPSGAVKAAMPGMLAGGPCAALIDEIAKKKLQKKAPLACYVDHQGSFSTNEITIYWNSPLVYLIARIGL